MPHKTREEAEQRAREAGIDVSQVTESPIGYFIAPQGIKSKLAKEVYAKNSAEGKDEETSAKIAWSIEKKVDNEG